MASLSRHRAELERFELLRTCATPLAHHLLELGHSLVKRMERGVPQID
jgi:hypothetical protein